MAESRHSAESAHDEPTMQLLRAAMQRTVETLRAAMETMRDDRAWAQATQPPASQAQRQVDASWDALADRAAEPDSLGEQAAQRVSAAQDPQRAWDRADRSHGASGPDVVAEDWSRPGASLGRNESEMGPAISEPRTVTTARALSQRVAQLRAPEPSWSQERQHDQGMGY